MTNGDSCVRFIGIILLVSSIYCFWRGSEGLRMFYFMEYKPKIEAYDEWLKARTQKEK